MTLQVRTAARQYNPFRGRGGYLCKLPQKQLAEEIAKLAVSGRPCLQRTRHNRKLGAVHKTYTISGINIHFSAITITFV